VRRFQGESEFSLERAMRELEHQGLRWERFQALFPFGFLGLREGEYVQLVEAALRSISDTAEQSHLMDLLDMQWCTYLEQLWAMSSFSNDETRFAGESERVNARLQIGSNIRREFNLPKKDLRHVMLSVGGDDTLADLLTLGISISPNRRTKFR
jgi:hypothetical protein